MRLRRSSMAAMALASMCFAACNRRRPALPAVGASNLRVEQVAFAGYTGCARVEGGGIYCWGQCGANCGLEETRTSSTAYLLNGVQNAVDFALGASFGCAVIADGSVRCWGTDYGGSRAQMNPAVVTATPVAGLSDVVEIESVGSLVCVRKRNGAVRCWGEGPRAATNATESAQTAVIRAVGQLPPVQELITAGPAFWGKDQRGYWWYWGGNSSRTIQSQDNSDPWAMSAIQFLDGPNTRASGCNCRILAGDTMQCRANGLPGALPSNGEQAPALQLPCSIGSVESVREGGGSGNLGCAVHRNGTVSCWGDFFWAEGDAMTGGRVGPSLVSGITDAVHLYFGGRQVCVLTQAGRVRCWSADRHPSRTPVTELFSPNFDWPTQ